VLSLVAAGRLAEAEEAVLQMFRTTPINAEVTFVASVLMKAMPDIAARAAFAERAVLANPHSRIRAMQAGVKAASPDAKVVARDRADFATEIFPPDDLIPELAAEFAEAPHPFARQLQVWARARRERGAKPAPITAYTVPGATLALRDGVFVIHDADGAAVDLFAQRPSQALIAAAEAMPVTGEVGPVFLVSNIGMINYAHWCLDILPQLAVGATHFPQARLVVPELATRRFMAQTLAVHGFDPAILTGLPAGRYRTQSVTLLSASVQPTFRHALQFGNRAYARVLLDRSRPGPRHDRRLFIDRPPSQRRTVVNRADLLALLDRHGFETLDPGTLPVSRQAELFGEASHVLGLHGAALANLMHCRAGTRVLEIHSPDHTTTAFAITAMVRGCDYRAHIAQSIASEGRLWAHPQDMDFRVDPAALERDVAWLLQ
jgi:capsular polysaccharide biosynthesis protein